MSGDMTSRRYQVVATTRRSWTRQQKKAIVAEIDVGGATLSEVARRHGIHASLLFRWRKALGSLMGGPAAFTGGDPSPSATPSFMPVLLSAPAVSEASPAPAHASTIEIVLDGRRSVRVGTDVDTSALVRIIEALEKSR